MTATFGSVTRKKGEQWHIQLTPPDDSAKNLTGKTLHWYLWNIDNPSEFYTSDGGTLTQPTYNGTTRVVDAYAVRAVTLALPGQNYKAEAWNTTDDEVIGEGYVIAESTGRPSS